MACPLPVIVCISCIWGMGGNVLGEGKWDGGNVLVSVHVCGPVNFFNMLQVRFCVLKDLLTIINRLAEYYNSVITTYQLSFCQVRRLTRFKPGMICLFKKNGILPACYQLVLPMLPTGSTKVMPRVIMSTG